MDGVLIDSEPMWREVEISIFRDLGLELTEQMAAQTMGWRINEVVEHWYGHRPWSGRTREEVADAIVEGVVRAVHDKGALKDGAVEAIDFFGRAGMRLAIASSSFYRVIEAVLATGGLADRFDVVHSAEEETKGKPDPAVYLSAASKLGVEPGRCLAFEDAPNGVVAAKAAGMVCVAVPDAEARGDDRFGTADLVLHSLRDVDERIWARTSTVPMPKSRVHKEGSRGGR